MLARNVRFAIQILSYRDGILICLRHIMHNRTKDFRSKYGHHKRRKINSKAGPCSAECSGGFFTVPRVARFDLP